MLLESDWRYKSVYDWNIRVSWLLLHSSSKAQRETQFCLYLQRKGHFANYICSLVPSAGRAISKILLCSQQSLAVQNCNVCTHRHLPGAGSLQQPQTLNKFQQADKIVQAASCPGPLMMKAHSFFESDSTVAYILLLYFPCFILLCATHFIWKCAKMAILRFPLEQVRKRVGSHKAFYSAYLVSWQAAAFPLHLS